MARLPTTIWTKEMLSDLGKISDPNFSLKYGIAESTIKRKRNQLGIPGYTQKFIVWNKFADLFMVASDEQIAKGIGLHPFTVHRKRVALIAQGFLDECFDKVSQSNEGALPRIKEFAEHIRSIDNPCHKKKAPTTPERKIVRRKRRKGQPLTTNFPKELAIAKVKRYPHTALLLSNRSKKPLQEFCEQMSNYHPSGAGFDASLKTMRAWGLDVNERWEILRHLVQQGIDTDKALLRYLERHDTTRTSTTNQATGIALEAN